MKMLLPVFLVSILLFIVGMILVFPGSFYLCEKGSAYFDCKKQYDQYETLGVLLALFAPIFLFASIIVLSYLKIPAAFHSWARFAKWYLPIAAVLILLSPTTSTGIMGFDKEIVTWWLAGIFFVVSLGIIFKKSRAAKSS